MDNKEDDREDSDSVTISQMEGGDSTPPSSKRKEHPSVSPEAFRKMRKVRRKPILEYHDLNISKWWRRMERESLASKRMEFQEPERLRAKKSSDWKLGNFYL